MKRGCDLLILFFHSKIKRSQPSAAPTDYVVCAGISSLNCCYCLNRSLPDHDISFASLDVFITVAQERNLTRLRAFSLYFY
ncbi:hypothetical protein ACP3TY_13945 [Pseudomonas rustica]|uniref:hypothetical protein n=1 Tax=Pseudomonas rustica TaxID=2827099 RepID=UPI003CF7B9C2